MKPFIPTLAILLVMAGNSLAGPYYDDYYHHMNKISNALVTADKRLVDLSRRDCQAGSGHARLCEIGPNKKIIEILQCVLSGLKGRKLFDGNKIVFDREFKTIPNVAVFTSGLTWFFGGSYEMKVTEITTTYFKVGVTGGAPFSVGYVEFNYIACDKELKFDPIKYDHKHHGRGYP